MVSSRGKSKGCFATFVERKSRLYTAFKTADRTASVSFVQILAPELTDRLLADFLDLDDAVTVNLHIQSIDQAAAIKAVKGKLSDLNKMKIEEQKRAVRSGYDMDVLPSDLVTYGEEAKNLLTDLQSRNERMFLVTFLVMSVAKKRQRLDTNVFAAAGIAQKYNCALKKLDFQQEQGLMSSLVLGKNEIEIQRGLTTSSTAIFVPFTTCELFQKGEALHYWLASPCSKPGQGAVIQRFLILQKPHEVNSIVTRFPQFAAAVYAALISIHQYLE